MPQQAWFLVGPTAAGKSAVAQRLAEQKQTAIISADSMLVYRGMDIGTAKPSAAERRSVTYWGMDCVEPDQTFSAGDYLRILREQAGVSCEESVPRIVVGGTGLYMACLLNGLREGPPVDRALRESLETLHREGGVAALQRALEQQAPGRLAQLADPKNPRRLIRAIELAQAGVGTPEWDDDRSARPMLVGLRVPADRLAENIERRVYAMYENGLLAEASALRQRYPQCSETARQAIGYAEAWAHLDGACTREQAIRKTILRTRQLAKRQTTWFRHQARVEWVDWAPGQSVDDIALAVDAQWRLHGPAPLHI